MKLNKLIKQANAGTHAAIVNQSDAGSVVKVGDTVFVIDSYTGSRVPAVVTEVCPVYSKEFKEGKTKKRNSWIPVRVKTKSVSGAWRRETWRQYFIEGGSDYGVRLSA